MPIGGRAFFLIEITTLLWLKIFNPLKPPILKKNPCFGVEAGRFLAEKYLQ
jgi:hypothetical protein